MQLQTQTGEGGRWTALRCGLHIPAACRAACVTAVHLACDFAGTVLIMLLDRTGAVVLNGQKPSMCLWLLTGPCMYAVAQVLPPDSQQQQQQWRQQQQHERRAGSSACSSGIQGSCSVLAGAGVCSNEVVSFATGARRRCFRAIGDGICGSCCLNAVCRLARVLAEQLRG